jgi:hypothetical protein
MQALGQNGIPRPDVLSLSYGAQEFPGDADYCAMSKWSVSAFSFLLLTSR